MPDNLTLDAGSGGSTLAAASLTISGDTAVVQMVGMGILSGSEGSWTHTQIVGDAGVLGAGVQRVTIATDDEVNNLLGTIDADTGAMVTDLAAIEVLLGTIDTDTGAMVTDLAAIEVLLGTIDTDTGVIAGDTTSIDGKITACNTGAVVISSGTVTTVSSVTAIANALPAGSNAIGKLAANSGVDIGDVDVTSISAGTNTIGGTISQQSTSIAYDGTTSCTIKRFHATTSTSDTSIITAVAGKKFRVLSLSIIGLSATATNVHLETKTTNTDCFGDSTNPIPIAVDADGDNTAGVVLNWNPGGWFETADANEDMAIILSAAQPVLICGNYIEVA